MRNLRALLCCAAAAALVQGCASFGGSSLVAGRSTTQEIEALMGPPAQRLQLANGDRALYFSRLPAGRAMFVVTVGPDGLMKSIEQRLERANVAQIVPGGSTMQDVRALFGPPARAGRFERMRREWWEYPYRDTLERRVIYVQFSYDGVVREVYDMLDPDEESRQSAPRWR